MIETLKTIIESAKPYKRFDLPVLLHNYETIRENFLDLSTEEVKQLEETWNQIKKENHEAEVFNRDLYKKGLALLEEFCEMLGIQTWKTSKHGKVIGEYKDFKMLKNQLSSKLKTSCPYSTPSLRKVKVGDDVFEASFSPCSISQLHDHIKHKLEVKRKNDAKNSALLVESVKFLTARGFEIPVNEVDVIKMAEEIASREFLQEEYPEGTELDTYYGKWIVGEKRSEEGNRMELIVDGNLVDGFYAHAETY